MGREWKAQEGGKNEQKVIRKLFTVAKRVVIYESLRTFLESSKSLDWKNFRKSMILFTIFNPLGNGFQAKK